MSAFSLACIPPGRGMHKGNVKPVKRKVCKACIHVNFDCPCRKEMQYQCRCTNAWTLMQYTCPFITLLGCISLLSSCSDFSHRRKFRSRRLAGSTPWWCGGRPCLAPTPRGRRCASTRARARTTPSRSTLTGLCPRLCLSSLLSLKARRFRSEGTTLYPHSHYFPFLVSYSASVLFTCNLPGNRCSCFPFRE